MKVKTAAAILLAVPLSANALDVNGYEQFKRQSSESSDAGLIAKALLGGYFSGLADQLNFMSSANMLPLLNGTMSTYCVPKTVTLTANMLQALADSELRNTDQHLKFFGPDWKSYTVTGVLVYPALVRNYPCK